jgi:hypothetical protein
MNILEDGGEMIVMSFICWYVFTISSKIDKENILSSRDFVPNNLKKG